MEKIIDGGHEIHPLKATLQRKGLSQVWLAKALGVNIATLNAYLNNYRVPPPELKEQLELIHESLSETEE